MPDISFPVINGIAPSWADIVVKAAPLGAPLLTTEGIAAINSGASVEIGEQRGASGGRVKKRTTGAASHTGSLTLYRDEYQRMLRVLATVAPRRGTQVRISLVHFDIQVQHTPPNSVEIFEFVMKGCRLAGRDLNDAEGSDAQRVEVPLSVLYVADIIDGQEVVML